MTRVRSFEQLGETGEQKRRAFRENIYKIGHLLFEEAFELNNLDLLPIIGRFALIYIHSKIQRGVLFNKLSIFQDTQNKID